MSDKRTIMRLFIRVCEDSGFALDEIRASHLVGSILNIMPLQVWLAFGDLRNMARIANGTHPCLALPNRGIPEEPTP